MDLSKLKPFPHQVGSPNQNEATATQAQNVPQTSIQAKERESEGPELEETESRETESEEEVNSGDKLLAPVPDSDIPSLYGVSVREYTQSKPGTVQRYKVVRRLLEKLNDKDWNDPILHLPNINLLDSVNSDGFEFKDHFISMVNRSQLCTDYITFLKEKDKMYLFGTSGIGKSFIIYQMAARLMTSEEYRVVYINNADDNVMMDCFEILRIILAADEGLFITSQSSDKEKHEWQEYQEQLEQSSKDLIKLKSQERTTDQPQIIKRHIHTIASMYDRQSVKLVFMIDQINNLEKLETQLTFCQDPSRSVKLVLGVTETNEWLDLKIGVKFRQQPPMSFNAKEFNAFRTIMHPSLVKTEDERDNSVMLATGGLPVELNRFFSVNANAEASESIETALDRYLKAFDEVYNETVVKSFILKHDNSFDRERLKANMTNLILQIPMSWNVDLYDKRLISKQPNKYGFGCFLVPISTVAKKVLLDAYNPMINERLDSREFKEFMSSVFRSQF